MPATILSTAILIWTRTVLSESDSASAISQRRQPLLPVEQKHRAAAFGQIVYETAHQLLDFGLYQPAIGSVFAVGGGKFRSISEMGISSNERQRRRVRDSFRYRFASLRATT